MSSVLLLITLTRSLFDILNNFTDLKEKEMFFVLSLVAT